MAAPAVPTPLTFENAFEGSFIITNGSFNLTETDQPTDADGFPSPQNIAPNNLPNVERLIQVDQGATINVSFEIGGSLVSFINGRWRAEAFLEKMGNEEFPHDAPSGLLAYDPLQTSYSIDVALADIDPGIYRIVVCLTFENQISAPGAVPPIVKQGPVAAFGDLGLVKFYKEEQ